MKKKAVLLIDFIGCPRNMLLKLRFEDYLKANGWDIAPTEEVASADLVAHLGCGLMNKNRRQTLRIIEAGHPLPDENSLSAGLELTRFVQSVAEDGHLLLLVSGGASSLAELLPDDISLEKLQQFTDQMLAEGLNIGEINQRRKEISRIKNGKLLADFSGSNLTVFRVMEFVARFGKHILQQ